jgi:VIT1/CCC1 family predicted Fe2+/Mn2+ transporter
MMNLSKKKGISFGLVSSILTNLGIIVGLNAGTHSKAAVLSGILTVALSDGLSDSLGIHISEEAENKHTPEQVWTATVFTFLTKFFFSMTFIVPLVLLSLSQAVTVSIVWGFLLLFAYTMYIGRNRKNKWRFVLEDFAIAVLVIVSTELLGRLINRIL